MADRIKIERGPCCVCGKKTVERDGEAWDGRPKYICRNDVCGNTHTKGHRGEPWDITTDATSL